MCVQVWGLTAGTPHFSLEGHERGVNCLDYYPGGDKPYLLSGADDRTVKIWDYQTKVRLPPHTYPRALGGMRLSDQSEPDPSHISLDRGLDGALDGMGLLDQSEPDP